MMSVQALTVNFVCAKRNIIDAKHHIIAEYIICTECNIVHLCPNCGGMMLAFG